jgi:hypothetical protein
MTMLLKLCVMRDRTKADVACVMPPMPMEEIKIGETACKIYKGMKM